MAKRIVWSPQAAADRIQILDYWYKRLGTKRYSAKLDEIFRETIQLLSRHPILGRYREEIDARVFVKMITRYFIEIQKMLFIFSIFGIVARTPRD